MSEQSVATAKELLKVERQIGRVSAILDELQKKRAELLASIKG